MPDEVGLPLWVIRRRIVVNDGKVDGVKASPEAYKAPPEPRWRNPRAGVSTVQRHDRSPRIPA